MSYRIFLDDERFPPGDESQWTIVRSYQEFVDTIQEQGFPSFVSFDHDLGGLDPTGLDAAKYLVNADLDQPGTLPEDFGFAVHSQNPCGAQNIQWLLLNYLDYRLENS